MRHRISVGYDCENRPACEPTSPKQVNTEVFFFLTKCIKKRIKAFTLKNCRNVKYMLNVVDLLKHAKRLVRFCCSLRLT